NTFVHTYFADTNTGTATGLNGTIMRTNDGGANWLAQTSGTTVELAGVHLMNGNVGTIVGFGGLILRTTNGGATWIRQNSGATNDLRSVHFVNADTGFVVGYNGTILRTNNGGATWIRQSSGTTNNLFSVHFVEANTGTAVGTAIILRTTDGGSTWRSQPSGVTSDLYSVHFTDKNNGTAVGQLGRILRTTNGGGTTKVDENELGTPENYELEQNFPNPFNPTTRIQYHLPRPQLVTLKVYDMLGQEVVILLDEPRPAGAHKIDFDAARLSNSGVYFYRMTAGSYTETRKMVMLR
ncbi:MAG: YCF48-related protein, partial [bacterium]